MNDSKVPSDEEIGQLIDILLVALPSIVSDLFGKPVPRMQLTKKKRDELIVELREIITRVQKVEGLKEQFKEPPATQEEWRSRLDKVSDELAPIAEIPKGVHFADHLSRTYALYLVAPLSVGFFKETNYANCLAAINETCSKAFEVDRSLEFDKLFDQALGSSDLLPVLQSYLSGFKQRCKLLEAKSKYTLKRKDAVELIEMYGRVSGDFEKAVRLNVGMLRVLEGEEANYEKASSQPFASNIQFLKKRHAVLVQDFSSVIRNSIAHGSYFISLSNESVDFRDNKRVETVTFQNLLLRCKMLIASALALTLAPAVFMHRRWEIIWQRYSSG